jgi:cob(I)alamin adenosyltransferase
MSIATKRGDSGTTSLPGGVRVSKTNPRVECYGTIDELISQMGFARSITGHKEVHDLTKEIQRELFKVGSAIGTAPESSKPAPVITQEMVDALEAHVHRIEAMPGTLGDWSLHGEIADSAAMDVARTICRRGSAWLSVCSKRAL